MSCKPKCFLLILIALCIIFVYMGNRVFNRNIRRQGFVLQDTVTSATENQVNNGEASKQYLKLTDMAKNPILNLQKLATSSNNDKITDMAEATLPHFPAIPGPSSGALAIDFDPHGNDSLVVIHTQKTGGSEFLRHLVTLKMRGEYLCILPSKQRETIEELHKVPKRGNRSKRSIKSKVKNQLTLCPHDPSNPEGEQWLIAEKTIRWSCGVHASYSEYTSCLPALSLTNPKINMHRRVNYAVILRHPVLRYLSEYFHVQRNATWSSRHVCGGRRVSEAEMPPCYPGFYRGKPWTNLTLSKYVSCKSNWGNNRQTRMLADMESVHCYDKTALSKEERDRRLLASAKSNLRAFSFFGLTEYMSESCLLFEKTFGMTFAVRPGTRNLTDLHSGPALLNLWNNSALYEAIERANHLDVQLYEYALELFIERAGQVGIAVNRELVEEEVQLLRTNPHLLDKSAQKFRKLDFRIS